DIADIYNQYGNAKARVQLSTDMNPGQLFMPIHWGDTASSHGKVCRIVSPEVDPISAQPEAKFTPVAIKPWAYTSEAIFLSREPIDTQAFEYWVQRQVNGGYLYYIAQASTDTALIDNIKPLAQVDVDNTRIEFNDNTQQQFRCATMVNGEVNTLYIVAPRLADTDYAWLDNLL
ncbi:molybdopterin dinucleotide binding domain-containing protein, partial [Ancylomarina sp. 16SWW S1-10-2]|uniref:molybdopterin dinucleotide binding domain-containing protein n=1 Tax=Ancylomarina sp. 16SWW S1-10-2 TaxID=2499681 RepID=UPI001D8588B4